VWGGGKGEGGGCECGVVGVGVVGGGGEPVQNYTLFSALSIVCKAASTT